MCKHQEYNDLGQEICLLDGKLCYEEDCDLEEPSEYDVINGWFDNDPSGLRCWIWKNKGCPKCKSNNIEITYDPQYTLAECFSCNHQEELD